MGIRRTLNCVSFRRQENSFGPMPIANSVTPMPFLFAAK